MPQKISNAVRPLTVYKASAGSGKTFTLAVEYIKLLIDKPESYETILAVTFTNKATEEMKSRILTQLYGISVGLPDSKDYLDKVCSDLNIEPEVCVRQAKVALRLLLHHYNFFRVQTIDTFFQGVMRNLARELSLSNNLRVSLNDDQVIGQAVDALMESLSDNPQIMSWIEEYVNENMDNDKSWDINKEIKEFGNNIKKEFYKSNRNKLDNIFADAKFFADFKKELSEIRKALVDKYTKIGQQVLGILANNGLEPTDFSRGNTGVMGYFVKLSKGIFADAKMVNSYVKSAMCSADGWVAKSSKKRSVIIPLVETTLLPLLLSSDRDRMKDSQVYNSVSLTLANMNKLRLLRSIEDEIKKENGEHSRFLLSDTQTLLYEMVKGDPAIAPFIYEKIGSYLSHIMIDEFQDTSKVQWKNFKVLLENCMSQPTFPETDNRNITNNLIVGDVKQSIYRFRSGDWRLLNNIDNEFNTQQLITRSLQTNYRSECNIITFNNLFFRIAAGIEADRLMPKDETLALSFSSEQGFSPQLAHARKVWADALRKAYDDVCQEVPASRAAKGYVKVELLDASGNEKNEAILESLLENIQELADKGVAQNEMAILVRTKNNIPLIANYFAQHASHLKLISQEAYRLDSSVAVMMIVMGMRMVLDPKDNEARAILASLLLRSNGAGKEKMNNNFLLAQDGANLYLPEELTDKASLQTLSVLPLYELAERMLRILHIDEQEGQTIYISTFFDKLNAFATDNVPDLKEFLDYWASDLSAKTVEISNVDGIRIMSIHKSKGLEFDHVLMPFCNWNTSSPFASTLWCEVDEEPFSRLPFIPVEYRNASSLKDSVYEMFGYEESMQEIVDNLNLLYVAFTRAGKSLIVIGERKAERGEGRAKLIADTLQMMVECEEADKLDGATLVGGNDDKDAMTFAFGTFVKREHKEKTSENVFCAPVGDIDVGIHSFSNDSVTFRQSNKSRDFADDITDEDDSRRYIRMGTILHQVFSSIRTLNDVNGVLANMEFEGMLYDEDLTQDKLRQSLREKFSNPEVREWFSDRWKVFNECTILYLDNEGKVVEKRPDRVICDNTKTIVIDYKFGKPHKDYENQVRNYMNRLISMGYANVEGYLWFVNKNEVVRVN